MRTEEQKRKHAEYMRRWKAANPEKYKAVIDRFLAKDPDYYRRKARQWRIDNPERRAEQKRRNQVRAYGITPEQYTAMAEAQSGRCAICSIKPNRELDIDHCHKTGKVRGLLCSNCNKAIGSFKDNTDILMSAIRYLQGIK